MVADGLRLAPVAITSDLPYKNAVELLKKETFDNLPVNSIVSVVSEDNLMAPLSEETGLCVCGRVPLASVVAMRTAMASVSRW